MAWQLPDIAGREHVLEPMIRITRRPPRLVRNFQAC